MVLLLPARSPVAYHCFIPLVRPVYCLPCSLSVMLPVYKYALLFHLWWLRRVRLQQLVGSPPMKLNIPVDAGVARDAGLVW